MVELWVENYADWMSVARFTKKNLVTNLRKLGIKSVLGKT